MNEHEARQRAEDIINVMGKKGDWGYVDPRGNLIIKVEKRGEFFSLKRDGVFIIKNANRSDTVKKIVSELS